MATKKRAKRNAYEALMDELAESVAVAPDEELIEDVSSDVDDESSSDIAQRTRRVLLGAVREHRQSKLREAHKEHERRASELQRRRHALPESPAERRALLDAVIARNAAIGNALLTAQHREFSELTDADIESYLRQLAELGALDEPSDEDSTE